MSCGGTSFPRRKVALGGFWVKCAQSRGEWPGSRITFLDGRDEGARVEVVGARDVAVGAREREGGPRRVDAVEGGGRRAVDGFGGGLKIGILGVGLEVGSTSATADSLSFGLVFEVRGGSIEPLAELTVSCGRGAGFDSGSAIELVILGASKTSLATWLFSSAPSRVIFGIEGRSFASVSSSPFCEV